MTAPKHDTKKPPTQAQEIADSSAQELLLLIVRKIFGPKRSKRELLETCMPTGVALEQCHMILANAEKAVLVLLARQLREKNAEIHAETAIAKAKL